MILHWAILHRNQNKQRCFYKGMHVHKRFLTAGIFTQTYYWIISCGGHTNGAKSSASICKITVSPQIFDGRDAFRGKGLAQDKPTLQFDLNAWRSAFRSNGLRFVDINPCCPAARREKLETIKVVGVCKKLISTCVFTSATSNLHISTSRFQKKDFRLHLYIFRTTPAYGIYSFGSCVKEDSVNLHLWICT